MADATTDFAGRFRLGPIEPVYRAQFDLCIDADGFGPQYIPGQTYSIFSDSDCDLGNIGVYRGRVFSGQVVDVDGKPRAGARVECDVNRYVMGHTICDVSPARTVTTDADGRFRTPPLPVGHASLSVREPERQLTWVTRLVEPGGEETLAEPMRLANDIPVAGLIKDEEGRPIDGVAIEANSEYRAISDPQGHFVLRGFGPNPRFQTHMAKEGYVGINRSVTVGGDSFSWEDVGAEKGTPAVGPIKDFTVVMKRQAWIEGQTLDAETGEPVRLDKVVLCTFERKPNGEILRAGCKNSNFEQPETGRFRVPYSYPDEYTLTFSAAGYQDAETFTPLVKDLQPISGITVKLKKDKDGAKLEIQRQRFVGRVTRDGKPLKSGWVGLWALRRPFDTMNAHIMRGRTATGDPIAYSSAPIQDGAYSLDVPFQQGGWYVVAEAPGQAITQVGPFRIAANEEQKLDIACIEGGSISGRVQNVLDAWRGQLWVVAFSPTAVRAETRIDADGNFSFERLPQGKYGLKVGHDAYEDSEVPRAKDWKDIPKDAWTRIADPWKRAIIVKIEAGQAVTGVQLELPQ
ncbi:MAG: carboxypeptidase regulatory-like domain-containing protein [Planctomycetia bacterium]|nr:carboxypeptidase regulatory-like domain-containing protein [Planctomycetia bacterium]